MKKVNFCGVILLFFLLAHARGAVQLPAIDCLTEPQEVRCIFEKSRFGFIGQGPSFTFKEFVSMGSGYVDKQRNKIYVPIEIGHKDDQKSLVMEVDLITGDRQVVSGYDGHKWYGRGMTLDTKSLGYISTLRQGPNGQILAMINKKNIVYMMSINPKNGDRHLIWKNTPSYLNMMTSCQISETISSTFEIDQHTAYFLIASQHIKNQLSLIKMNLDDREAIKCSKINIRSDDNQEERDIFQEFNIKKVSSGLRNDELIAVGKINEKGNIMLSIHLETGKYKVISLLDMENISKSKGGGDIQVGFLGKLAIGQQNIATLRASSKDAYPDIILVDPKNGNRILMQSQIGSLSHGRDINTNIVASIPNTDQYIISFGQALHLWSARTGQAFLLSQ